MTTLPPGREAVSMLERALQTLHRRSRRWPDDPRVAKEMAIYEWVHRAVMEKRGREIDLTKDVEL